jgi:hypothetical protein
MSGDVHVRFCESRGVRFPPATHLVRFATGLVGPSNAGDVVSEAVLSCLGSAPSSIEHPGAADHGPNWLPSWIASRTETSDLKSSPRFSA